MIGSRGILVVAVGLILTIVTTGGGIVALPVRSAAPDFVAFLHTDEQRQVVIELGVVNRQTQALELQGEMVAVWNLQDSRGTLRASGTLEHIPRLAPGEGWFPLHWSEGLEPGHYVLTYGYADSTMQKIDFQVVTRESKIVLIVNHETGL